MSLPVVYVASPLGFFEAGRHWMGAVLLPALAGHVEIADPWALPAALRERLTRGEDLAQVNTQIAARNRTLIEGSDALLAVLDGSDVDSGTAAEIGYAAARAIPVVGLRTDWRVSGDNAAAIVNLQVEYFVGLHGGAIVSQVDGAVALLLDLLQS